MRCGIHSSVSKKEYPKTVYNIKMDEEEEGAMTKLREENQMMKEEIDVLRKAYAVEAILNGQK